MKTYIIDFRETVYYLEMHQTLQKALDFPDYYGCNWDAFWDCLTDMYGEPIRIEIVGIENIERRFEDATEKMLAILKEFKYYIPEFSDKICIAVERNGAFSVLS